MRKVTEVHFRGEGKGTYIKDNATVIVGRSATENKRTSCLTSWKFWIFFLAQLNGI